MLYSCAIAHIVPLHSTNHSGLSKVVATQTAFPVLLLVADTSQVPGDVIASYTGCFRPWGV